jgi:hypothetical protein
MNSEYRFIATYSGSTLFNLTGAVPEAASNLRDIVDLRDQPRIQPFPVTDFNREARIVQDLQDLMHAGGNAETERKIKRWIKLILQHARRGRRWWFLENLASRELLIGNDVIDLTGHLDRVIAVFAAARLRKTTLAHITELRMTATRDSLANGGYPSHYAPEAGKRIHLWPAPHQTIPFAVLYTRPMDVAILPDEWESIIVDGVLGRYGRHFDRDALTQDPEEFERRYLIGLKDARKDTHDTELISRWDDTIPPGSQVTADSGTDTATANVVPASLTGVGYVSIETGNYIFQVA